MTLLEHKNSRVFLDKMLHVGNIMKLCVDMHQVINKMKFRL